MHRKSVGAAGAVTVALLIAPCVPTARDDQLAGAGTDETSGRVRTGRRNLMTGSGDPPGNAHAVGTLHFDPQKYTTDCGCRTEPSETPSEGTASETPSTGTAGCCHDCDLATCHRPTPHGERGEHPRRRRDCEVRRGCREAIRRPE